MLISLMAVHNRILDMPILYVSPAMETHKDEYIDRMYSVSAKGDWAGWINFFFDRISESCRETIRTIDRIIDLQSLYRQKATASSRSVNPLTLIDALFERPIISINDASRKLGVTYAAAKATIDKLVELNIVQELAGVYPKAFYSPSIMRASRPDVAPTDNV